MMILSLKHLSISYLLITGMLNTFGVSVAAASGIGLKVNTFAGIPCWAIGQTVTAMVGQNMGAKNIERVKKITQSGLLINVCVTLIAVVLVQLFSENIIMLFDPAGTDVIKGGFYIFGSAAALTAWYIPSCTHLIPLRLV